MHTQSEWGLLGRRRVPEGEGERVMCGGAGGRGGYDQNTLHAYIKLSKIKLPFETSMS